MFNKVTLNHFNIFIWHCWSFLIEGKKYTDVYIATHFDVSKIYKSLKSWPAITFNLKKINKWVNVVMGQRALPLLNFQFWSYDVFTENRYFWISHANLAIWWWRSSKVSSRCVCFCMSWIILNSNYSWIFLCYFSNNKKILLMIYWLYL